MVPGRPKVLAKMISPRRYSDREARVPGMG